MNSQILLNPSLTARIDQINQILQQKGLSSTHPDVLYFDDDQKLGVDAAKKIREHLSLKPYSAPGRLVILESAHKLTLDAQNALLKTLEEPPQSSLLLLAAETEKNFLPTVLSRCQIIQIEGPDGPKETDGPEDSKSQIENVIESSIEERFSFVEKLEDRQEFLEALIKYYQQRLALQPGVGSLKIMKILLEAEEWSKANGNVRAILEYLMLKL